MKVLPSLLLPALLLFSTPVLPPVPAQERPSVKLLRDSELFDVLRDHLATASREIVVIMFLFKAEPYSSNRAYAILQDLIRAKERGVSIRVFLEKAGRSDDSLDRDNLAVSKRLSQHGIHVRFDSPGTITHAKTIVIDGRFVFIGSHNLTHSALCCNHELSVLVDNPGLARNVLAYLKEIERN